MKTSDDILKLAAALWGLQLSIKDARKDQQAHNYKYAKALLSNSIESLK